MASRPVIKVIPPRSIEELMREIQGDESESLEKLERSRAELLNRPEWRSSNLADLNRLRSEIGRFTKRSIDSQRRLAYGAWALHQLSERQVSRSLT